MFGSVTKHQHDQHDGNKRSGFYNADSSGGGGGGSDKDDETTTASDGVKYEV